MLTYVVGSMLHMAPEAPVEVLLPPLKDLGLEGGTET
jgi:hypothetical protein